MKYSLSPTLYFTMLILFVLCSCNAQNIDPSFIPKSEKLTCIKVESVNSNKDDGILFKINSEKEHYELFQVVAKYKITDQNYLNKNALEFEGSKVLYKGKVKDLYYEHAVYSTLVSFNKTLSIINDFVSYELVQLDYDFSSSSTLFETTNLSLDQPFFFYRQESSHYVGAKNSDEYRYISLIGLRVYDDEAQEKWNERLKNPQEIGNTFLGLGYQE